MTESFGTLLRKFRTESGWSTATLAKRVNYSKGYLSKIENDLRRPTPTLAKLCDQALDTGGALAAALSPAAAPAPAAASAHPVEPDGPDDEMCVLAFDESGELRYQQLPRRLVLAGAGAILGTALVGGARPAADERTVAGLRATFDQLRSLGTMTSPLVVLGQAIAHVQTLVMLIRHAEEPVRTMLLLLASRVAEYAGWMSQEAGDERGALMWLDRAVAHAAAGADPHLASFALVRRAELAMYRHDPIGTVELARRAQRDPAAGPRILGLAAQCEAQGHALAGDPAGYERALDRAAQLLAVPPDDGAPVLGSTSVADPVSLVRGWSLCELGRPAEAAEVLDRQVPQIAPTARRARARFGARRALAHAQQGEVDHACEITREVLADATHVDSATIRLDLRLLSRTLHRWHDRPAVREIRPELMAVLHTTDRVDR